MPIHILNGSTRDTCLSDWLHSIIKLNRICCGTPCACVYMRYVCVYIIPSALELNEGEMGNTCITWCFVNALPLNFCGSLPFAKKYYSKRTYGIVSIFILILLLSLSFFLFECIFHSPAVHFTIIDQKGTAMKRILIWTSEYSRHKQHVCSIYIMSFFYY